MAFGSVEEKTYDLKMLLLLIADFSTQYPELKRPSISSSKEIHFKILVTIDIRWP